MGIWIPSRVWLKILTILKEYFLDQWMEVLLFSPFSSLMEIASLPSCKRWQYMLSVYRLHLSLLLFKVASFLLFLMFHNTSLFLFFIDS